MVTELDILIFVNNCLDYFYITENGDIIPDTTYCMNIYDIYELYENYYKGVYGFVFDRSGDKVIRYSDFHKLFVRIIGLDPKVEKYYGFKIKNEIQSKDHIYRFMNECLEISYNDEYFKSLAVNPKKSISNIDESIKMMYIYSFYRNWFNERYDPKNILTTYNFISVIDDKLRKKGISNAYISIKPELLI
jgi:hypothetical protein